MREAAERIYYALIDMDYMDYIETYEKDILFILEELEKNGTEESTLEALQELFI